MLHQLQARKNLPTGERAGIVLGPKGAVQQKDIDVDQQP